MPLIITTELPPGESRFRITQNAQMPEITVTAVMQGSRHPANGPAPTYEWSAELVFDGGAGRTEAPFGSKSKTRHPPITPQTGTNPSWRIPFTKIRGGQLTVKVVMRAGNIVERANGRWLIIGSNPSRAAVRTFANSIGANRVAFRKMIRHESTVRQFLAPNNWPLFSSDGEGGVGLCQLTNPKPTEDQIWDWKENVRGGWDVFKKKEDDARRYPVRVLGFDKFRALVAAWNRHHRPNQRPLPVDVPAFTAKQLEHDTLRGYNGYSNGWHEYRLRLVDDILHVNPNADGTRGTAEWERTPTTLRTEFGDPNYVENVLNKQDF